jgi:hypothetical protein
LEVVVVVVEEGIRSDDEGGGAREKREKGRRRGDERETRNAAKPISQGPGRQPTEGRGRPGTAGASLDGGLARHNRRGVIGCHNVQF